MRYRYSFESSELEAIFDSVRDFSKIHIMPDIIGHVRADTFPRTMFTAMGDELYLGSMIPVQYGGLGFDMRQFAVVMEGVAAASGSVALGLAAHHSLASTHILLAGSEEQKAAHLPHLADGSSIGSWCLTETGSGSDAFGSILTRAERTSSGWHLYGSKMFVTNGSVADIYVVIAHTPEFDVQSRRSFRGFIVPKGVGVNAVAMHGKLGMRASDTAEVSFDVDLPQDAMMPGDGYRTVLAVLDRGRIGIAALACGLMRSSYDRAVSFAKQRSSCDRSISEYQAISHSMAEVRVGLDISWLRVMDAALDVCQGRLLREKAASTKLFVTEQAVRSCLASLMVMGGTGYFDDQHISLNFADAILLVIGEGTSNTMKNIIARSIFN